MRKIKMILSRSNVNNKFRLRNLRQTSFKAKKKNMNHHNKHNEEKSKELSNIMTNGDMDITYDMLENINSILPKISNVSPIGKIYTKSTERKLKRKANFKAKSNITLHPEMISTTNKPAWRVRVKLQKKKTRKTQIAISYLKNKHQEYLNAVKSNDNLISERTQNPFKLQPFDIKAVKLDSHNRGLEMDKSVRIIDQSMTSQRFYVNPKYSPNNYSTISGVNSKDPASRKSRNFDESRFKSLDSKHTYKEDHDSIFELARKCESNILDAQNYITDFKCKQTILELKQKDFIGTVNMFQEIENADISVLKLMYDYKIDSKMQDLHTANDVIKEYKSGITDPSRYVAKLERNIKQRIMKRKRRLGNKHQIVPFFNR